MKEDLQFNKWFFITVIIIFFTLIVCSTIVKVSDNQVKRSAIQQEKNLKNE